MSAEIPTDDPREKDSAKNFPQNAPPPYTDENLDDHTCPLISPLAAHSPQSQPDHYLEIPSCPSQVSQFPANAKVTVSRRRANRTTVIETRYMYRRPNNYMEYSIFNLFCCSFFFGAIALYYSLRVNTEYSAGRIQEAIVASKMAKTMNCVSFIFGTVVIVFFVVVFLIQVINSQ